MLRRRESVRPAPYCKAKNGSASHGQSQQDGNKENHQRVGGTDGGQCAGTYTLSYNQRVGYVVTLL